MNLEVHEQATREVAGDPGQECEEAFVTGQCDRAYDDREGEEQQAEKE